MKKHALLATFALVEIADLLTTNSVLAHGGGEANPIMAWSQHELGGSWAVPKLALASLGLFFLSRSKKPNHIAAVVVVCAIAPVWNLLVLQGM
jgi:hypothetical protein